MRLIGNVKSKQHAERISAFLLTRDISTHCEDEGEQWDVWVRDEDFIDVAKAHLKEFNANPDDAQYRQAVEVAQKIVREKEKKLQEVKANQIQMTGDRWNAPITKVAPFTVALVAVCVVVSLFMTQMGKDRDSATFRALSFASISNTEAEKIISDSQQNENSLPNYSVNSGSDDNRFRLASIKKGEFWRTITPAFIHFGIFHLLFNMYWMVIFGKQIEFRYGSAWLAFLVVLTAVPSNLAQCLVPDDWGGSPIVNLGNHWTMLVGGMSGVLYGLFGYIWMKMTFDPKCGLYVSMSTVAILIIWMFVCMNPAFEMNIGNWAHGIGLIAGMILGYLPKLMSDIGIRKSKE